MTVKMNLICFFRTMAVTVNKLPTKEKLEAKIKNIFIDDRT